MSTVIQESAANSSIPSLANAPEFLTEGQVRAIFNIPHSSLALSISQGYFPSPIRISKQGKRWLKSALIAFVNRQTVNEASQAQYSKGVSNE